MSCASVFCDGSDGMSCCASATGASATWVPAGAVSDGAAGTWAMAGMATALSAGAVATGAAARCIGGGNGLHAVAAGETAAPRRDRSSADPRRRSCSDGRCPARGTDRRDTAWRGPTAYRPGGPYGSRARQPVPSARPGVRVRASRPTHFQWNVRGIGVSQRLRCRIWRWRSRTGHGSGAGGANSTPVDGARDRGG